MFYNDTEMLNNPFDYFYILIYKENYTNSIIELADYLHSSKPVQCQKEHLSKWNSKISEQKMSDLLDITSNALIIKKTFILKIQIVMLISHIFN